MNPSSTDYKVIKAKRTFHKEAILNFKRSEMERNKENTNLIEDGMTRYNYWQRYIHIAELRNQVDDLQYELNKARAVARELGVNYYEASIFTYYGVNKVFENSIRTALIARRQQRFWMMNLKRVQRPLLQAPFCPPKPIPPEVRLTPSTYEENMKTLWMRAVHTDVTLITASCSFSSHRCLLAAASPALHRLFTMELVHEVTPRSSSEYSMVSTFGEATAGDFNDDTELCLIRIDQVKPTKVWEQLKRRSTFQVLPTMDQRKTTGAMRELNHPAFQNIRIIL
ncbi:hypothetical protein PV325_012985, partial [Microctonus aethiopoides]